MATMKIVKKICLFSFICFGVFNTAFAMDKELQEMLIDAYTTEFNISRDEAIKRIDLVNHSQPIIDEIKEKFGDSIAGIYFDNGNEFKLVVRTTAKGKDLKDLRQLAKTQNKLPVLVIRNSPRNQKAIANIIKNQGARLSKKIDGFMMMGYDPVKDKIIISIYEPDINKQNQLKNDKSLRKILGMETEIEFIDKSLELNSLK